jgi:hypothetical protein
LWKKSKVCASCTIKSNNQTFVFRWMPKTQGKNLKIIIIESCHYLLTYRLKSFLILVISICSIYLHTCCEYFLIFTIFWCMKLNLDLCQMYT